MQGPGCCGALLVGFVEFAAYPFNEPALVCDRHCLHVAVQESSVVRQEEGWFKDQLLFIFRPKAKET